MLGLSGGDFGCRFRRGFRPGSGVAFMGRQVCMDKTRDRVAGAAIAVLLQLGLVTIFIYSLPLVMPAKRRPHEITFFLPRLREAVKPHATIRRGRVSQ